MQEQQQQEINLHKKHTKKRNQQLSTIIENGESYIVSPNHRESVLKDIDTTPKSVTDYVKQDTENQQSSQQKNLRKKPKMSENKSKFTDRIQVINEEQSNAQLQEQIQHNVDIEAQQEEFKSKEKVSKKSNSASSANGKSRKENQISTKDQDKAHKSTKSIKKQYDFKEDEMIKNIKISLTNIPVDLDLESQKDNKGKEGTVINEYEISWNVLKFFLDKKIRCQEKLLFFVSLGLILADIGASIYEFYIFASTSCFGYEADLEFSDVVNIITSVVLKFCSINIIMQEITNTLPGNMKVPFLIPLTIMGITPNLQLTQYVYSFSSCTQLNPVFSFRVARTITRLLCYLFISLISLICILIVIIRIEISRSTWKRLKNIGFYILIGGFLLTIIFIFIFASVLQANKQFVLPLCLDNATFWTFFVICVFYTIRKLYFKIEPFPYQPEVIQQMNSQAQLYVQEEEQEKEGLTETNKEPKSNLKKKKKKQVYKEDSETPNAIIQQIEAALPEVEQEKPKKKKKKKIMFSPEVPEERQNGDDIYKDKHFSFHKANHIENMQKSVDSTDSQAKMVSSLEKSPVKLNDDYSLPESHQDAATTSSISNLGSNKQFKFSSTKNKKFLDSPLLKPIIDDQSHPDDSSQPNSKTSLSRKHHDNFSNASKSSLKEEGLQLLSQNNSQKSIPNIIINQDQSVHILNPKSFSEFQKKDMELFQLNKQLTPNQQNNHFMYPETGSQSKDNEQDKERPRIRSLNKLDEDQELSEQQIRKYSLPRSDNGGHKNPFEVKKKSLFERQIENIEQQQD